MKKVTLLGDSIRQIGYGKKVPELLGNEFTVFQPAENCRFAKFTLRGVLHEWRADIADSDVIHWNNGLWDTCDLGDGVFTEEAEYVETMLRIARQLKQLGKVVIFATTTPVRPERPNCSTPRSARYNAVLVPKLQEMGILINDLYALVSQDVYKYIREDDQIHLTDEGIQVCAEQVVRMIKDAIDA